MLRSVFPVLALLLSSMSGALAQTSQRLELPSGLPPALLLAVDFEGESRQLVLERRSLRSPGFRVRAFRADGSLHDVAVPESRTYQGFLLGDPTTVVGASLGPDGLTARVIPQDGPAWSIQPDGSGGHLVEGDSVDSFGGTGSMPDEGGVIPSLPGSPIDRLPSLPSMGCPGLKLAEIAFDVDFPYYQQMGSSLPTAVANVEAHLAVVDAFYARDVLITYRLTEIIVREAPFYLPDATTGLLDLFRIEWATNLRAIPRDIAHLMTGQPAPGLAGLAFVNVVCNLDYAYGWSVDSSGVVGHELGHNWSAGHCHDSSPCNNMCGACLLIAPNTKNIIAAHRDSRTCLEDVASYDPPIDPYAHPNTILLEREDAALRVPVLVDVLGNDHDANCDDFSISSFEATTARGGLVSLAAGTGPMGRDELSYTPPCALFSGTDRFEYSIADEGGLTSTSWVTVDIRDAGLAAYWPLDETVGLVAADVTGFARDGVLVGDPAWGTGRLNGALSFDGIDDHVVLPALNLSNTETTITGWFRREGTQAAWAGLLFYRAGNTVAGLNMGTANELRYHWQGANWDWDSGLILPDATWVFLALVVESDRATLYMHDGISLQSAEHAVPHGPQDFAGEGRLGQDSTANERRFRGSMDDIRVFPRALAAAEVTQLQAGGGPAVAPSPADGSTLEKLSLPFSWTAAPGADSHDVYFGTDYPSVRDALSSDSEFQVNQTASSWDTERHLLHGRTYYWRVDTHVGPLVIPGTTWLVTVTGRTPILRAHWRLDDGGGATALDAARAALHGTVLGDPLWIPGVYGGALELDGNDAVTVPALSFDGVERTVTAWIRRDGDQSAWAGIFFTRAAGSTAGFNFGVANELRYHWGIGAAAYDWDSGLVVPDGTWVFVALVIEPGRGRILMNDGSWSSAENLTSHPLMSFDGEASIGRDPTGGPRWFRGGIDDLRVYDRALSDAELDLIWSTGGPAESPSPADGARLVASPTELSFLASANAVSHDLYFGETLAGVRDATPASSEFLGTQGVTRWPLIESLVPGRTYYWRVDEDWGGPAITTGPVWHFGLAEAVGATLRMRKTPGKEPWLSWEDWGSGVLFDIERCDASAGPCVPTALAQVGPGVGDHQDLDAPARLHWYLVKGAGDCFP